MRTFPHCLASLLQDFGQLNAVEWVNGCLSRQKKAVGMQRLGTKGGSAKVVLGREKRVLTIPQQS
jgi:hypothetical protein